MILKDRITAVMQIYHQRLNQAAYMVGNDQLYFSRQCETEEQPYLRSLIKATEEWSEIDTGWIPKDKVGLLVIFNEEGKHLQANPTEKQAKEIASKVLEVSWAVWCPPVYQYTPPFLIRPREVMPFSPSTIEGMFIRSRSGIARYTICALPG